MMDRRAGTELAGVRASAGALRRMAAAVAVVLGVTTLGAAFLLATLVPAAAEVRSPAVLLLVVGFVAGVVIVVTAADRSFREPGVNEGNIDMFRNIVAATE